MLHKVGCYYENTIYPNNMSIFYLEETKSFAMSVDIAAPCQCAQQSKDLHIFILTNPLKKLRIKGS